MPTRTISDTLYRPDGTPWEDGLVTFALRGGFVATGGIYPPDTITVESNASGIFTATLWVSDESASPTAYEVTLPNEYTTHIHVPVGVGMLTLTELLAAELAAEVGGTTAALQALITIHEAAADQHSFLRLEDTPNSYAGQAGKVVAVNSGATALELVTPSSTGHIIADEGTALAAQPTLNFIGAGVTATNNAGSSRTDVTIPGGGAPTGAAGGVLGGTYPNPGFAVDMATQAELDSEASTRAAADTTNANAITAEATARASADSTLTTNLAAHIGNTSNPHNTTAAQVGAPTTAAFTAHTGDTANPHAVTAAQAGAFATANHLSEGTPATMRTNLGLGLVATLLGAVARAIISKAGTVIGTRRQINFIEGSNVTLTVADNSGTESVDITIASSNPGGTVSSVGLSAPAEFSVSGSPVTTTGTLAFTKATQSANLVWAGPTTGSAAAPAFRALVPADLPAASGSAAGSMSSSDFTKLAGIATGATANSPDATLLARANHTGTQGVATITGLGDAATKNTGTTAGTVAAGDDSRLTNARTPTAHASSHHSGGGDALALGSLAGTLTDGQHGSRGGGTLHAEATDTTPGFLAALGAAVLAFMDLDGRGRPRINGGLEVTGVFEAGSISTTGPFTADSVTVIQVRQGVGTITADTTLTATGSTIWNVDATTGDIVITLPDWGDANVVEWRFTRVDNVPANTVTIEADTTFPDTIEGAATITLDEQWAGVILRSGGNNTWTRQRTGEGGGGVLPTYEKVFSAYAGSSPYTENTEALSSRPTEDCVPLAWTVGCYVDGTNDGSNYWTFVLRRLTAGVSVEVLATMNTSAESPTTWTDLPAGGGAHTSFAYTLNLTDIWVQVMVVKTGSPGNLIFSTGLRVQSAS